MMKNLLKICLFSILIVSCGYSPMYSKKNIGDFSIQRVVLEGDFEINQFIRNRLKGYINEDDKNGFLVEANSDYQKRSITKDATGNTTKYEIFIKTNFLIKSKNDVKDFAITEVFIMKSFDNKFEEAQYEKTIKNNLSSLIADQLMVKLQN